MRKCFLTLALLLLPALTATAQPSSPAVTQGSLYATTRSGDTLRSCPLKSTSVEARVSGFIARVNVRQEFENTFAEPIEAIYTFPLSAHGAVDEMTMKIGERTVRGKILKKQDARKVYETARDEGKTAGLLDQERPNVFTQAVANIMPGETIVIEISYIETLRFDDGSYAFVFPMTVAPRYEPGPQDAKPADEEAAQTIPEMRPGHDISIDIDLDAGVPIEAVNSPSHKITTVNTNPHAAKITLEDQKTIPNKDFVLRYDVTGKRIEDAVLAANGPKGGFFSLVVSPPGRLSSADMTPKEIVFVLDTSGSMSGFPIEKAKESIDLALDGLNPGDTFNLITFAGDTALLFDKPVPATNGNLERARAFLAGRDGGGGTEMMKAIRAALTPSDAANHLRIVCFMTDGLVGNDMEIIAEVKKHPNARVFSFGIGDSVNRFLLDTIAKEGRGEAEYVMLTDDGSTAARRFYERLRNPYLTDISIDWAGAPVTDIYPKRIPDLFGASPVVVYGRFTAPVRGKIKLTGKIAGQQFEREIELVLPAERSGNDSALATLWARTKVDDLMSRSWDAEADEARPTPLIRNRIIRLGLDFGLMTQYTSFVAVEERMVTRIKNGRRVQVPVYAPAGTAFEREQLSSGTRADASNFAGVSRASPVSVPMIAEADAPEPTLAPPPRVMPRRIVSSGVINGKAAVLAKPVFPAAARATNTAGAVSVQVIIDEAGRVVSASAVSGHPLLRRSAEQAALRSSFQPTLLSGSPVKVTGVIVYNFSGTTALNDGSRSALDVPTGLTAAEQLRWRSLSEKLHVWLFSLVQRLDQKSAIAGRDEARFVTDGRAAICIVLTKSSKDALERLKNAGFEIAARDALTVTGRIDIEKIADLVAIEEVKLVWPKI